MHARNYRPEVARFLTEDRYQAAGADQNLVSDPLTQNRYAFLGGNPVSRIEFDGHDPCSGPYQRRGCKGGLVGDRQGNTVGTPSAERCACPHNKKGYQRFSNPDAARAADAGLIHPVSGIPLDGNPERMASAAFLSGRGPAPAQADPGSCSGLAALSPRCIASGAASGASAVGKGAGAAGSFGLGTTIALGGQAKDAAVGVFDEARACWPPWQYSPGCDQLPGDGSMIQAVKETVEGVGRSCQQGAEECTAAVVLFGLSFGVTKKAPAGVKGKPPVPPATAFEKAGIATTEHFRKRLAQRPGRGITDAGALHTYRQGRLFHDPSTGRFIRRDSRTGVTVVTDAPSGGTAVTVFQGPVQQRWNPVRWRPGQ